MRVTNARVDLDQQLRHAKNPESRLALDLPSSRELPVQAGTAFAQPGTGRARIAERLQSALPPFHSVEPDEPLRRSSSRLRSRAPAGVRRAKLRAYALKVQIRERKGDASGAKRTYQERLAFAKALPADTVSAARQRIETARQNSDLAQACLPILRSGSPFTG